MQLELVGCTGAGKSTLAKRIAATAQTQGVDLVLGDDFALHGMGCGHLRAKWLRAVAVHVVAFWGCITRGWRHVQFIRFSYQVLRLSKIPRHQQWNQLRKVFKQLGRYEVIGCGPRRETSVLVDEGTLHTAHNLFVHVGCHVNEHDVRQFAERVPLPDVVIYVREREDTLVERTLDRGHPRISDATFTSVSTFIRRAVETFEQLSKHERIASRTLVIQDGMILSGPMELSTPEMKRVFEVLRGAIEMGTLSKQILDCEPTHSVHSKARLGNA